MLRSILPQPKNATIRGVNLYFSPESVIVAAMHQNLAGIYYEQSAPVVIQGIYTAAQLGRAFRDAFDSFSIKDADLRESKNSEWPAFKVSGLRSVKEFERQYRPISSYGINTSNAIVRASVAHPVRPNIELSVSFNPLMAHEQIGDSLMQLFQAANAT